jgi:hypothetical protein
MDIAVEAHHLGAALHFDTHRYDGRFDFFNEVSKSDGTLGDFGGVGRRRVGRKAGLTQPVVPKVAPPTPRPATVARRTKRRAESARGHPDRTSLM